MEVLTEPERRRRRSVQEKVAIVQETLEPGATVSAVARRHGVNPNQMFAWRKQYEEGSLTAVKAGEAVVPASQSATAMKEIRELQRLLGKKTQEAEILKEAVEYGRFKKLDCALALTARGRPMKTVCDVLGVARSALAVRKARSQDWQDGRRARQTDDTHRPSPCDRPGPGRVRPRSARVVATHVRRLEALRRAGIVERVAEGLWTVPDDLVERGRQHDAQRLDGVVVELKSHLPIERQARVIGATWLDQQLIGGGRGLGDLGFGGEAKQAMQQRADFLVDRGWPSGAGSACLARNVLGTLRNQQLTKAAKEIAAETGLEHRPVADGQRVAGIYRRSVMLTSGRYAMLDDGLGFSLVPWKPVIEQRLGQQLAAAVRGGGLSWELVRLRGLSII
ncbi:DUF3363 domain-containing protein [Paraburkholderia caledonica]|uniref:DUF3363 domain-containing protein n=1 Tax=Paraburkholderia caledonica TaxID=134536 RepID=UPI0037098603